MSSDSPKPHRPQTRITVLAAFALVFSGVALVVRLQPVSSIARLIIAVGATFVPAAALAGLLLAVVARRVVLVVLGAFLVAATSATQVLWYYVGNLPSEGGSTDVRVLSSNLREGRADPAVFVQLAAQNADVITVSELTPEAVERFTRAGITKSFQHSHLMPAPRAGGIGIWSRYPLTPLTVPRRRNVTMPAARIAVPGVQLEPVVASVHVKSPVAGDRNTVDDWRYGMAGAKAQLDNFAREAGIASVIISGDYNSTPDMRQFRDLLTNGYRDAVEQLGAGFAPTFPADMWLPPLITIDHILTRNAAAASIRTVSIKGSDHRALLATVRVRS
jgi:endonuclease/exonuclease/phosphatase (EEP) superfamily protein YafD